MFSYLSLLSGICDVTPDKLYIGSLKFRFCVQAGSLKFKKTLFFVVSAVGAGCDRLLNSIE